MNRDIPLHMRLTGQPPAILNLVVAEHLVIQRRRWACPLHDLKSAFPQVPAPPHGVSMTMPILATASITLVPGRTKSDLP